MASTATSAPGRAWTAQQDAQLLSGVAQLGVRMWPTISTVYLQDVHSADDCRKRWFAAHRRVPTVSGPWTDTEDATLRYCVQSGLVSTWSEVATLLPARTAHECRDRWALRLSADSDMVKKWTGEQDKLLVAKQKEFGTWWVKIASFFPGRSIAAIKHRWRWLHAQQQQQQQPQKQQLDGSTAADDLIQAAIASVSAPALNATPSAAAATSGVATTTATTATATAGAATTPAPTAGGTSTAVPASAALAGAQTPAPAPAALAAPRAKGLFAEALSTVNANRMGLPTPPQDAVALAAARRKKRPYDAVGCPPLTRFSVKLDPTFDKSFREYPNRLRMKRVRILEPEEGLPSASTTAAAPASAPTPAPAAASTTTLATPPPAPTPSS